MKQISYRELKHIPDGTFVSINDIQCRKVRDGIIYQNWYGGNEFCSWITIDERIADGNVSLTIYM